MSRKWFVSPVWKNGGGRFQATREDHGVPNFGNINVQLLGTFSVHSDAVRFCLRDMKNCQRRDAFLNKYKRTEVTYEEPF